MSANASDTVVRCGHVSERTPASFELSSPGVDSLRVVIPSGVISAPSDYACVSMLPGRPFTQPVRLALLLGVEVRFIPVGEPGRNADIESFNALWQARVLRRFAAPSLRRLARLSDRFERWFMDERPHPKLSTAAHGTRFPGALLAALRRLPQGVSDDVAHTT